MASAVSDRNLALRVRAGDRSPRAPRIAAAVLVLGSALQLACAQISATSDAGSTACGAGGAVCDAIADCCSKSCVGGRCAACVPSNGACAADGDCCSGLSCYQRVCRAGSPDGATCSRASDCLSGGCERGLCAATCSWIGGACASSNCCAGLTCSESGFCCMPLGSECNADGDCCSSACVSGTCACPTGSIECNSECTAVSDTNCGACGAVCGSPRSCANGACKCPGNQIYCADRCVSATEDESNCGACNRRCPAGADCVLGHCSCPAGRSACGDACVDKGSDAQNCGECGHMCNGVASACSGGACVCPGNATLCGAECVEEMNTIRHCRSCDAWCPANGTNSCFDGGCGPDLDWELWPVPPDQGTGQMLSVSSDDLEVLDRTTGLVWERHSPPQVLSVADAHQHCSSYSTGSHPTGWRVPTRIELISILDFGHLRPAIDLDKFPGTRSGPYFYANLRPIDPARADGTVDFARGTGVWNTSSASVRCVWSSATVAVGRRLLDVTPEGRFSSDGQTVVDSVTRLRWPRTPDYATRFTWLDAIAHCEAQSTPQDIGWHLPSIKELISINSVLSASNFKIASPEFAGWTDAFVWTATANPDYPSDFAAIFSFGSAGVQLDFPSAMSQPVICVQSVDAL